MKWNRRGPDMIGQAFSRKESRIPMLKLLFSPFSTRQVKEQRSSHILNEGEDEDSRKNIPVTNVLQICQLQCIHDAKVYAANDINTAASLHEE